MGNEARDIPARAGQARNQAGADRVADVRKYDRDRPRLPLDGCRRRGRACQDDIRLQADQLPRERSYPIDVSARPPKINLHVAAVGPTQVRKRLCEGGKVRPLIEA